MRFRTLLPWLRWFAILWPVGMLSAQPAVTPTASQETSSLLREFDRDRDGRLDEAERRAARDALAHRPAPPFLGGPQGAPGANLDEAAMREPAKVGADMRPSQVAIFAGRPFYDDRTLRTLFLSFDDPDWEPELAEFEHSDVLVPADLMIEGQNVHGVGVRFASPQDGPRFEPGYKRSLEIVVDFSHRGEDVGGERRLQLLDASADPTLLRSVLYARMARDAQVPTPQTNFVRLVINGEDWGVYVNRQPFDAPFAQQNFGDRVIACWEVSSGGTLAYLGDDPDAYRSVYRLQSADSPEAWRRLIALCRTLDRTPFWQVRDALAPQLDLEETLRFLALENVLINEDGYRERAGGYGLVLTGDGRFHFVPLEAEDTFRLVATREVTDAPRERPAGRSRRADSGETTDVTGKDARADAIAAGAAAKLRQYPRQTATDLALLLSNSFVNKADANDDQKLTRDEWLNFANAWFRVMDEEQTDSLTRAQFVAKLRDLVSPPSIRDGRSRQSFGKEDASTFIAQDFFATLDQDQDEKITRDEFVGAFGRWFDLWREPKTPQLTQAAVQQGLESVLSKSVFEADRDPVKLAESAPAARREEPERSSGRRGSRRGGGPSGGGENGRLSVAGVPILGRNRAGPDRGSRDEHAKTSFVHYSELDPMAASEGASRPLLAKLLGVQGLHDRYLKYVHDFADNRLLWSNLGPIARAYQALIAEEVRKETHKPFSYERFVQDLDQDVVTDLNEPISLKAFVEQRRAYLLKNADVSAAAGQK
jgi:Ca2+-binding EF-hand superfamily protein